MFDGFSPAFNYAPVNVSFLQWLDDTGNSGSIGIDTRFYTEALWYYNDDAASSVVSVDIYSQVVPSYSEVGGSSSGGGGTFDEKDPVFAAVSSMLFDKRTDNEVSGDIIVLSSNYVQTNTPEKVTNYSAKNAFIQCEAVPNEGHAYTGTYGFCILSVIPSINAFKLSGDL